MTREQAQPFDESAALAELERLRQAIMAARRLRQQKSDEFDAFVQGFRKPASAPPAERMPAPDRSVAPPARVEVAQQAAVEAIAAPETAAAPSQPAVAIPSHADAATETVAPAGVPAPRRARIDKRWAFGIGGVAAVIALGVLATRTGNQSSPPPAAAAVPSEPASAPPAETPAAPAPEPPAPAPAQQDAHAVVLDLRTLRPVWMRVVVDGEKKSEGMVQGGESLHFGADDSIAVRVGNGGDVLVKNGDREDPFGDVDQPVTRRFAKR